ncbi:MAG: hypothetical protein RSA67_07965, partial [Alistipes sp.]
MRILIAIQNRVYSEYLTCRLSRYNHEITLVHNGLDAINALKENVIDVVVLGMTLEYFNGLEVVKLFREYQVSESVL